MWEETPAGQNFDLELFRMEIQLPCRSTGVHHHIMICAAIYDLNCGTRHSVVLCASNSTWEISRNGSLLCACWWYSHMGLYNVCFHVVNLEFFFSVCVLFSCSIQSVV